MRFLALMPILETKDMRRTKERFEIRTDTAEFWAGDWGGFENLVEQDFPESGNFCW
jgi:hypothetical protein